MKERRKAFYATVVVVIVCVLLTLLAEGAVRARALLKYGYIWGVESTFEYDKDIDLRLLKADTEFGPIRTNSLGFRGPEIERSKRPGRVRIAFLGGSTTYCAEVSSNEVTWPHLVWKAVSTAKADREFDYVNGGVPGYGTKASLKNLQFRVADLDPDIIIIYHATNDLSTNSFVAARNQGIVEQRPAKRRLWLSDYSLLAHLVETNLRIIRTQQSANAAIGTLEPVAEELAVPFREHLTKLVEASKQEAELVVLVTFSSQMRREQSVDEKNNAAASSLYYMPYMSPDGLIDAFAMYNNVIRDVAREQGALLVEAELSIPGDSIHFNDSVHFKDAGSRLLAERVADVLLASDQFSRLVSSGAVNPN
jgi:lysophospholipase L1-like esterase